MKLVTQTPVSIPRIVTTNFLGAFAGMAGLAIGGLVALKIMEKALDSDDTIDLNT